MGGGDRGDGYAGRKSQERDREGPMARRWRWTRPGDIEGAAAQGEREGEVVRLRFSGRPIRADTEWVRARGARCRFSIYFPQAIGLSKQNF